MEVLPLPLLLLGEFGGGVHGVVAAAFLLCCDLFLNLGDNRVKLAADPRGECLLDFLNLGLLLLDDGDNVLDEELLFARQLAVFEQIAVDVADDLVPVPAVLGEFDDLAAEFR